MRPTKEFRAAYLLSSNRMGFYYFRLLFVSVDEHFFLVFNRFHSMTKKLYGSLTQQ